MFVKLYQIIQLGHHMDCIIQHRGIRDIQKRYQRFHFHRSQIFSLLGQTMQCHKKGFLKGSGSVKTLAIKTPKRSNICNIWSLFGPNNVSLDFFLSSNLGHLGSVEKSAIKLFKIGISRISETNTECPSWYVRPPTRPPFIQLIKSSHLLIWT